MCIENNVNHNSLSILFLTQKKTKNSTLFMWVLVAVLGVRTEERGIGRVFGPFMFLMFNCLSFRYYNLNLLNSTSQQLQTEPK